MRGAGCGERPQDLGPQQDLQRVEPEECGEQVADGLRALAVVAVLLYHGDVSWAKGGYFGVDAFFVLSGFLITSLLLVEWGSSGGIGLKHFWARRARRLLPALALVVGFVALYAALFASPIPATSRAMAAPSIASIKRAK